METLWLLLNIVSIDRWRGPFSPAQQNQALSAVENGEVLYFPSLAFVPQGDGAHCLAALVPDQKNKNISYDPASRALKGTATAGEERRRLQQLMETFSAAAERFVLDLFPRYAPRIARGRASYRPVEIAGRQYSRLKDDKLLHVDAFPSTPMRGRRILRLFCNIDAAQPRIWHIGEPFESFARRFLPLLHPPSPVAARLLAALGITRGRRSAYDQLMLALHNSAKRDADYQTGTPYQEFAFAAGSSWLCFTDQVVHAAVAGQHALEQTFYLDVAAMADPATSPLITLERLTHRKLC